MLIGVDWTRTRAYAMGINGLYLNLAGRERDGIVQPGAEQEALLAELKTKLEAVRDPLSDQPAIKHAYRADEVYHGPLQNAGPGHRAGLCARLARRQRVGPGTRCPGRCSRTTC